MAITALPTPPTRSDPSTFASRGDTFLAALPTFATEANALQTDVNAKEASAVASAATATTKAGEASTSAAAALDSQNAASARASAASASQTNSGTNATNAGNSATAANLSAVAAAASALVAGGETLASISKDIHKGVVVKSIIYDTSKDSDPAWRKRCTDKSWYTEALGFTGVWGGQAANVAAGWAACGSVTGGAYQNTTDGKFYTPTSVSTQTEIFRGNAREFPEQVAIVAEAARVVIYDLTQTGCPMWMVFVATSINDGTFGDFIRGSRTLGSVAAGNGYVCIGQSGGSPAGLSICNFVADSLSRAGATDVVRGVGDIVAMRNSNLQKSCSKSPALTLVSSTVNDVALTVLDTAPIDPATGLPVPTIFVGTAGGLSTITNLGTVTNSTSTVSVTKCVANGSKLTTVRSDGVVSTWADTTTIAVAPDTTYTASSTPAVLGTVTVAA